MQIFFASIKENIDRAFLSFILSIGVTYLSKDPIFQFLWMGKTLAGRNPAIQFAFIFTLFCLVFCLLFIVFRKQVDWFTKNYLFSTAIITLIPVVAYSIIGSTSRFVADDFSSATLAVSKGVIGATWDWYIHWSGRFSASFFDSLVGFIGPGIMPFITGSVLLVWLVALISVMRNFFLFEITIKRFAFSLLISALVLITTFEVTPLLTQSLYWGQGMRSVILPLVLATFLISILHYFIFIKKTTPVIWLYFVALLSFFAGGFGETYVVLQTSGYLLLLLFFIIENPVEWKKDILAVILVGLLSSIAAMVITIIAPGNNIRQGYFPPPPDVFDLIQIAAVSFWQYFLFILNSPIRIVNIVVLFLVSIFTGLNQKRNVFPIRQVTNRSRISNFVAQSYPRTTLVLAAISLSLLFVCFIPAAYGMSTSPPERTLVIPTFVLSVALSVLGLVSGQYLSLFTKKRFSPNLTSETRKLSVWMLILLFSFYIIQISNQILVVLPDYRHFADVFDRADSMIRQAKAEGKDSVMVPEVHNHFGLSDFGAGTTYWLDEAVNSYYGIAVIVNKHMK